MLLWTIYFSSHQSFSIVGFVFEHWLRFDSGWQLALYLFTLHMQNLCQLCASNGNRKLHIHVVDASACNSEFVRQIYVRKMINPFGCEDIFLCFHEYILMQWETVWVCVCECGRRNVFLHCTLHTAHTQTWPCCYPLSDFKSVTSKCQRQIARRLSTNRRRKQPVVLLKKYTLSHSVSMHIVNTNSRISEFKKAIISPCRWHFSFGSVHFPYSE